MSEKSEPVANSVSAELARAKTEAEIRKLQAEAVALQKGGFLNPVTWLSILTAIVALSAALGQCASSQQDVKIAAANNEAAKARADQIAAETKANSLQHDQEGKEAKARLDGILAEQAKAEREWKETAAAISKAKDEQQLETQKQLAQLKKDQETFTSQLEQKRIDPEKLQQLLAESSNNPVAQRALGEQQKTLGTNIENSQNIVSKIESVQASLKPVQWAYYGDLDPQTRDWKFVNFVRDTGDKKAIPMVGDSVTATTAVNARRGPILHQGDTWTNQPVVGYVRENERLKVLEVKQPPADLSDQDHSVWIMFERVPR